MITYNIEEQVSWFINLTALAVTPGKILVYFTKQKKAFLDKILCNG